MGEEAQCGKELFAPFPTLTIYTKPPSKSRQGAKSNFSLIRYSA